LSHINEIGTNYQKKNVERDQDIDQDGRGRALGWSLRSSFREERSHFIHFLTENNESSVEPQSSRPHTPWTIYCKVLTKLVVAIEREGVEEEAEREKMAR
jgi:hypothetical protein